MASQPRDLAQIRFDNAMALLGEFVRATIKHPDAATLRGLDGRFAERLLIQPSYWSQIKSRSRQIGERLARQFEQRCNKPAGWLDATHDPAGRTDAEAAPSDGAGAHPTRWLNTFAAGQGPWPVLPTRRPRRGPGGTPDR